MTNSAAHQQVDWGQARELLRVFLRNEWRGGMNARTRKREKALFGKIVMVALQLFLSLGIAAIIVVAHDIQSGVIFGGVFVFFIVMFYVVFIYGRAIISADDYLIIAPLPVSSRTYYVAKSIHFLLSVSIITLSLTFIPVVAAIVVSGNALTGLETLVVFWLSGILSGQIVSVAYTLTLRFASPAKVERFLAYTQSILSLSLILVYFWMSNLQSFIQHLNIDSAPYIELAPPFWFSAPFRALANGWSADLALAALAGVVTLGVLYRLSANTLGLDYAQSLLRSAQNSVVVTHKRHIPIISAYINNNVSVETRAILTLMRAQLRGDAKFRLQTLAFLPVLLIPLVTITQSGSLIFDPLSPDRAQFNPEGMGLTQIYGALFIFPAMLAMTVYYSSAYKASWIFFTAPLNRSRLLTSPRIIALFVELVPMYLALTGVFAFFYGDLIHAALHALFIVSIMRMSISIAIFFNPGVPFSTPMPEGGNNFSLRNILPIFISMVGILPIAAVETLGYGGYPGYALYLTGALLLGWALERVTDPYLVKRYKSWEFLQ